MNPSFLNDLTEHRSRWDSLPLADHNALILGYTLLIRHPATGEKSRAWMRRELTDCIDNFLFCCNETEPAKPGNFARRYK